MKFRITQETNLEIEKVHWINELSLYFNEYFEGQFYGGGVDEILVGLICVRFEFEPFFKPRKLRYRGGNKVKMDLESTYDSAKSLSFDVKLDLIDYSTLSEVLFKKSVGTALVKSLAILDKLPSVVKDFDQNRFRKDMEIYLRGQNLL